MNEQSPLTNTALLQITGRGHSGHRHNRYAKHEREDSTASPGTSHASTDPGGGAVGRPRGPSWPRTVRDPAPRRTCSQTIDPSVRRIDRLVPAPVAGENGAA
jgi:hypothetical protein